MLPRRRLTDLDLNVECLCTKLDLLQHHPDEAKTKKKKCLSFDYFLRQVHRVCQK